VDKSDRAAVFNAVSSALWAEAFAGAIASAHKAAAKPIEGMNAALMLPSIPQDGDRPERSFSANSRHWDPSPARKYG
jgi:hypothetical protein